MALKDWKLFKSSYGEDIWLNKKKNGKVEIFERESLNNFNVYINSFFQRRFKTKSQALKFAKEYMRKH